MNSTGPVGALSNRLSLTGGVAPERVGLRLKRLFDLAGAACAVAVLSPVILASAFAIRFTMGKPIFFRQLRAGADGRPFEIFKFRTMAASTDDSTWYRTDEQRVTSIGRFLRSTSLDELPTLVNVLRGEMSLVGPRPLLVEYLAKYDTEARRRHDVPPGMTGWAQIHGRRDLPFSRRLQLDVWYVDNRSMLLDVRILVSTVRQLFRRGGDVPGQTIEDVDDVGFWEKDPDDSSGDA